MHELTTSTQDARVFPPPPPPDRPRRSVWASLERKLPLLISTLLAVVVIGYCFASYRELRISSQESAVAQLKTIAMQLAQSSGQNAAGRLRSIAADTAVLEALKGESRQDAVSRLVRREYPRRDSTFLGIALLSASEEQILTVGRPASARDDSVLHSVVTGISSTDSLAHSPLYAAGDSVLTWTVLPVRSGRTLTGYVAERRRISSSTRTEQVIQQLTGKAMGVWFTNVDASLWTNLRGKPVAAPFNIDSLPQSFEATTADGEQVFGAHAQMRGTPWILVLTLSEADVVARPLAFLRRMLVVGLLLLILGALGAWILSRHVTHPLRKMMDAAEALAAGNFEQQVTIARSDEVGRLGATFNAMARRIGESHAQLEQQVEERSALAEAADAAREAAQEANEAKSAFLAMMSHELRTPLNAIGGYTELLELGIRGPITDAQREDLKRIRRNQQHLLTIINDILSLSRIEAGKLSLNVTTVHLATVVGEVESLIMPQVKAREVRYEVTECDPELVVWADQDKLQQVLLNLVSNAVRFTDEGGTVTVTCEADGEIARLKVSDTGIGIPPEKLEAIFEPFVQLDAGLTRRAGGTGLGLPISRTLATAMGGKITVDSVVGRGSVFTVELARAESVAATPAARRT